MTAPGPWDDAMPVHGDVIELIATTDPHTSLKPGDRGTVLAVDGLGTVHARWPGGSLLGLVPGADFYKLVDRAEPEPARLDGCTCRPVRGSHWPRCAWSAATP